jgi:hypothetical protein
MMDSVVTYGGWYILNNHLVQANCGGQNLCVDVPMLSQIIDYAEENRIKILSIDAALAARRPGPSPVVVPRGSGPDTHSLALAVGHTCVSTFPVSISFSATRDVPLDLAIYDVAGRLVRDLARVDRGPAQNSIVWDGRTAAGTEVVSGFYFCVLRAGDSAQLTRKIVVAR